MKRSNRKRPRLEEVVAKLRQADGALANGTPLTEVAVVAALTAIRGAPVHRRAANGPEMISEAVQQWCAASGTDVLYIDPGAPWQNGLVKNFNDRLRDELLSLEIFATLAEGRLLADRWSLHYNHRRIQRALGKLTPAAFAATCLPCTNSDYEARTDESEPVSGSREVQSFAQIT
jgi:transposase InsO family protein